MFDALKNLGNMGDLMKRAQEMQGKMKQVQDDLGKRLVSADAGGGMVNATVNGRLELVKIRIDKTKLDPNDTEMLEDLIVAAVAAAQQRAAQASKDEMQRMASEMGLPPGMLGQ
jgi:DNA-binding YbaB/EbfC family protein